MSLESVGEYYFGGDANFPKSIHVPAIETEDWARRLNQRGITRYVRLGCENVQAEQPYYELNTEHPYYEALERIQDLESSGQLSLGSVQEAMQEIANDSFETSMWSLYRRQSKL